MADAVDRVGVMRMRRLHVRVSKTANGLQLVSVSKTANDLQLVSRYCTSQSSSSEVYSTHLTDSTDDRTTARPNCGRNGESLLETR